MIFALIAAGFFYGISAGKRRIAATIIYTYVAYALILAVPLEQFIGKVSVAEEWFLKGALFLLIFLVLAFSFGSRRSRGFSSAAAWWHIFLLSFLQVGLLIHLILQLLPQEEIKLLAPLTRTVFANHALHIWWLIVPLLFLIILRRIEARDE